MSKKKSPQLPLYATVPNRGKGRVVEYHGHGWFTVDLGTTKVKEHRRNLTFTKQLATYRHKH